MKKTARRDHLAATTARGTINRPRAGLRTAALAFVARIELAHFNLLFHTKGCFLERDLHVITQVRPALSIFALPSGHATEEGLENSACPAAKYLAENIKRIVESTAET